MSIVIGAKHNQFWQQTSPCIIDGDKKLRNKSNIQQLVLKAILKIIIDTMISNTCCATLEKILYFIALHLHQPKITNLESLISS